MASVTNNTRDNAGNPLAVTETGVPLAGTSTYSYEAVRRPQMATYSDTSQASWAYAPVGNRTASTTPAQAR